MRHATALFVVTFLSGCAVGPNYVRPDALPPEQVRLQEAIANGAVKPTPLPARWWQLFADPELDRLVTLALEKNTDLRVAAANLQRARARCCPKRGRHGCRHRMPRRNIRAAVRAMPRRGRR